MADQTDNHQGNCFKDFRFLPFPTPPGSRSSSYPAPQLLENVSLLPADSEEVVVLLTLRWNSCRYERLRALLIYRLFETMDRKLLPLNIQVAVSLSH